MYEELRIKNEGGILKSEAFPQRAGFRMLVQLEEILAESLGAGVKTIKVKKLYKKLVTELHNELKILTKVEIEDIANKAGDRVAEGVKRVREGHLIILPGFDNTYGKVKIFNEDQVNKTASQVKLF
jgi:PHP family Zn ribbon phosphoesterase